MYYQQRHNKKIAENRKQTQPEQPVAPDTEQMFQSRSAGQPTNSSTRSPQPDLVVVPMSETNVSRINEEELHRRLKRPRTSLSHISRGSSIQENQDERFFYPKEPSATSSFGAACPLCSAPLKESDLKDKKWRCVEVPLYQEGFS